MRACWVGAEAGIATGERKHGLMVPSTNVPAGRYVSNVRPISAIDNLPRAYDYPQTSSCLRDLSIGASAPPLVHRDAVETDSGDDHPRYRPSGDPDTAFAGADTLTRWLRLVSAPGADVGVPGASVREIRDSLL